MRIRTLLIALTLAASARAQTPADVRQAWHGPGVAFTWPIPFTHVPQTFDAHAVRFTAPYDAPWRSALTAVEVNVWFETRSGDNFNDTVRMSFLDVSPDGAPDPAVEIAPPREWVLAEWPTATVATLDVSASGVVLDPGRDVWVAIELVPVGQPDTLVLVSDGLTNPSLDRTAARVVGEGWRLMRDTMFDGRDFELHVGATFSARQSATAIEEQPEGFGLRALPVWPVPASGRLVADLSGAPPGPVAVRIADVTGRIRLRGTLEGGAPQALDVGALPPGAYLLEATPRTGPPLRRAIVIAR